MFNKWLLDTLGFSECADVIPRIKSLTISFRIPHFSHSMVRDCDNPSLHNVG